MLKSEQINELAAALAKAQGEIKAAQANSKNPHYKSTYADITACLQAAMPALSKHGLALTQGMIQSEGGKWILRSELLHSSGQWIAYEMPLMMARQDMQGLGSALTYGRRYSFTALCAIGQEDDDGEANRRAQAEAAELARLRDENQRARQEIARLRQAQKMTDDRASGGMRKPQTQHNPSVKAPNPRPAPSGQGGGTTTAPAPRQAAAPAQDPAQMRLQ